MNSQLSLSISAKDAYKENQNPPYALDREIRVFGGLKLPDLVLEGILGKSATEFYCIE